MSAEPVTVLPTAEPRPLDDVLARLDDPQVAASLVLLLDNVESLALLAMGAKGLMERGETIADSLAEGAHMLRDAGGANQDLRAEATEAIGLGREVLGHADDLRALLDSPVLRQDVVGVLGLVAESLAEGRERARAAEPELTSPIAVYRLLKDDAVRDGLEMLVHVARALGRRIATT